MYGCDVASTPKTQKTDASVDDFLDAVEDEARRADCRAIQAMMEKATGEKAAMWGTAIVGFGSYHYVYASGTEGDWPLVGFSPRKRDLSLYLMGGFEEAAPRMKKLGPHKTGKSCLYLKSLDGIDLEVLEGLIGHSITQVRAMYPDDG